MRLRRPGVRTGDRLELVLALLIAVGFGSAVCQLWQSSRQEIWMDWFATSWWAHDPGMYDVWGTIYPPLAFVFLKIASVSACYPGDGRFAFAARDCDWLGVVALHGFYLVNIVLAARIFTRIDRRTALPRSIALAMGVPMAGALERGNLLIPAFTAVMLAYGPLVRSARLRWLAAGIAINFKVYLVAALFPQLLRRRWRWFEGAAAATVAVYLVTFGLLGDGTPHQIYANIVAYAAGEQAVTFLDAQFAATYAPLLSVMDGQSTGSATVDAALVVLPAALHLTQLSILLAAAAAWLRPEAVPMFRLTNLALSLALITAEAGGYTLVFALYFTFMERRRGLGTTWAIIACYLMALPFDVRLGDAADHEWTLGPLLRPALMMSVPLALSCVTIADVWRDVRRDGWKDRRRFRHDRLVWTRGAPRQQDVTPDR